MVPVTRPMLRLSDHMRACGVDGQIVLLDLRKGRYTGIGGIQIAGLSQAIEDWPVPASAPTQRFDAATLDQWTAPLRQQGILTCAPKGHTQSTQLAEPVESLNAQDDDVATFEWRELLRLWRASALTALSLRYRNLESVANAVANARNARNARHARQPGRTSSAADLRTTVAAYMHVRPFAFTAQNRCLHDSLTLVRFLGAHGLSAQWVIGIRVRPFAAHSWVQSGGIVLNDVHEHVRRYHPILVV